MPLSSPTGGKGRHHRGTSRDPKGYYHVLSVPPGAGIPEIHRAYAFLKNEWQRDRSLPRAQIKEAYDLLTDPTRKALYDAGADASGSWKRTGILGLTLAVLVLFGGLFFPGFLRPAPEPYRAGERLVRIVDRVPLGEVVRHDEAHRFSGELTGAAYLVRLEDGSERWFPAEDLERHFRSP